METHVKKGSNKRKGRDQSLRINQKFQRNSRPKRNFPSFECFTCHKMGNIARNFPLKAEHLKKRNKKFHAHAVENDDPFEEKNNGDEESTEGYVLISTLTEPVSNGSDTWLVESGSSRHMTGYKDSL